MKTLTEKRPRGRPYIGVKKIKITIPLRLIPFVKELRQEHITLSSLVVESLERWQAEQEAKKAKEKG